MPSYFVTVRKEPRENESPWWVARDVSNTWRSYADEKFASNAADAVLSMFYADEVKQVVAYGDGLAVAEIIEY